MDKAPYTWPRGQSLSAALTAMGLRSNLGWNFNSVREDGVEVFTSTRSDAYELCVLWLVRTRRVRLTGYLRDLLSAYRDYGLSAEVDAALASAVTTCPQSDRAEVRALNKETL